jgi:hypothetical protein
LTWFCIFGIRSTKEVLTVFAQGVGTSFHFPKAQASHLPESHP